MFICMLAGWDEKPLCKEEGTEAQKVQVIVHQSRTGFGVRKFGFGYHCYSLGAKCLPKGPYFEVWSSQRRLDPESVERYSDTLVFGWYYCGGVRRWSLVPWSCHTCLPPPPPHYHELSPLFLITVSQGPSSPHSCSKGSSLILDRNFWNWSHNLSLHYFVQVFVTVVCYFLATHPGQCQVFLTLNQSKEENNLLGNLG